MRRTLIFLFAIVIWVVSIGAERREPHQEEIDFIGQGFQKMYSTAYCMGHTTADGSSVFEGGCACSKDHIGDVAIVYTLDNEFIGYFICNDTGSGGVARGEVLDIYKSDLDRCQEYMELIGKEQTVWVKWIEGNG